MGIHYDYKSTRGDKAMKKEAKRKARIEQRRAKKSSANPKESEQETMHDINKPITLEDLTNPDKNSRVNEIFWEERFHSKKAWSSIKKEFKKTKKKKIVK